MVLLQGDGDATVLRSQSELRRGGEMTSTESTLNRSPLSVEEARDAILAEIRPLTIERVGISDALGRTLAEPVTAPFAIPSSDNTAMDGYAVIAEDVANASEGTPALLDVIADLPAGYVASQPVRRGQAIRIMTGAPIPSGADAVVMVEHTAREDRRVRVFKPSTPGLHIRRRGEDVREGEVVLQAGSTLRSGEVGMLASLQKPFVRVWRQPRVAIVSTGDELVEVGETLAPGKIVNSNSHSLAALVREAGAVPIVHPIARDTTEEISEALSAAASSSDVVLTTGGVSVGDYDYVKPVLDGLGARLHFWRVAMKPGKPVVFATLAGKPFFGLPGNPVSSMVGFHLFVAPALRKAMGAHPDDWIRPTVEALLVNDVRSTGDRRTFIRAHVSWRDGNLRASTRPAQGSGVLSSMLAANGLVIVEEGVKGGRRGDRVPVYLIGSL
jgi:molybdopterin molybdotransferase